MSRIRVYVCMRGRTGEEPRMKWHSFRKSSSKMSGFMCSLNVKRLFSHNNSKVHATAYHMTRCVLMKTIYVTDIGIIDETLNEEIRNHAK